MRGVTELAAVIGAAGLASLLALAGCDQCTEGARRCHATREMVEVCEDGEWQGEERCSAGERCLEDEEDARCVSNAAYWASGCTVEAVGS